MRRPLLSQRRALAIVVILLAFGTFLPFHTARSIADPPRDLVNLLTTPVTHPLKSIGDAVRRPDELNVDLGGADDYLYAKREIERLRQELREANRQIAELSRMRTRPGMTGNRLEPARVTAWSASATAPTLTLNRGTSHGVQNNCVVASDLYLVGKIVDTGITSSTVQLITAPTTSLGVEFVPSRLDAPPGGGAASCTLTPRGAAGVVVFHGVVDASAPVHVGDLAHLADPTWPPEAAGFVVGKVTAVEPHPDDPTLRKRVTVEMVRALRYLSEVKVVVPTEGDAK